MPSRIAAELAKKLTSMRLVEAAEMDRVCGNLSPEAGTDALIDGLLQHHLLTEFQANRVRKGELDGLVLGGVKLLYRNASGSFARVFRGASVKDGSMVGVKLLRERWSNDLETIRLFHREGEIGMKLKHPNIVPVYKVGEEGRHHYLTMEFVEGGNLRDFVKIRGRLEPGEAFRYVLDMASGLEYALKRGYTHRDLKTTNVLMSSQGVAKLIDFGLAADESVIHRIGGEEMQQALEYVTLERGTHAPRNDPRTDLFFLGTILYEMLTGEAPYPRTRDRDERKRFGRYRDIRPVISVNPALPRTIAQVVDRLLEVDPQRRYQSPTEVILSVRETLQRLGLEHDYAADSGANPMLNMNGDDMPTLLCVETRTRNQDAFRQYFTRHGFRVLILSDVDRVKTRLKTQPPDCLLLMGEVIGERIADIIQSAAQISRLHPIPIIAVLGEHQEASMLESIRTPPLMCVLRQPIQLREVRKEIVGRLNHPEEHS